MCANLQSASSEVAISGCAVGPWLRKHKHIKVLSLIVDRASSKFIVLVGSALARQQSRGERILTALQQVPQLPVSPFNSTHWNSSSFLDCVVAFEVDWTSVVGLDYSYPLCQDGRLVLEAAQVSKREFATVDKARAYYGCISPVSAFSHEHPPSQERTASQLEWASSSQQSHSGLAACASASDLCERFPIGRLASALAVSPDSDWQHVSEDGSPVARRAQRLSLEPAGASQGAGLQHAASLKRRRSQPAAPLSLDTGFDATLLSMQPPTPPIMESARSAPAHLPRPSAWPSPASWTVPIRVYSSRTLILWFSAPELPGVLRPAIESDEHLLKLYESGLPAWAVHMPYYGIFYRPWMRTVTWLLFVAISTFSLVMGFYDLYKNVPYLDQVLRSFVGSLHLPAAQIFRWLDTHVVVRLSILCAYLFGKSQLATTLLYWAAAAASIIRPALAPLTAIFGPVCLSIWQACQVSGGHMWATVGSMIAGLGTGLAAALSPLSALLAILWRVLQPAFAVAKAGIMAPVALVAALAAYLRAASMLMWQAAALLFKAGALSRAPARTVASQATWWYVVPLDAFEVVRASGLKVIRALQTLSRFAVQVGCDIARHRLTLTIRLRRRWAAWRAWWHSMPGIWHCWLFHRWPWPSAVVDAISGKWRRHDPCDRVQAAAAAHVPDDKHVKQA